MGIDSYLGIGKPEEKKEIRVEPCESKVVFEPKAVYEGDYKKLYFFDESLQALRERGYERHPRPAESFDLICRSLEGRLQKEEHVIVSDMINNQGEWLSMAMQNKGNLLHCYLDPENIFWDGRLYSVEGGKLKHSGEEVYDIQSLSGWVTIKDLQEINPELVEMLYSRPYALLPIDIRHAGIYFPSEKSICPMGRGYFYIYNINSDPLKASRGVIETQNRSTFPQP